MNHVVAANAVNTYRNQLDKFCSNQEALYDYKTDLQALGITVLQSRYFVHHKVVFRVIFQIQRALRPVSIFSM